MEPPPLNYARPGAPRPPRVDLGLVALGCGAGFLPLAVVDALAAWVAGEWPAKMLAIAFVVVNPAVGLALALAQRALDRRRGTDDSYAAPAILVNAVLAVLFGLPCLALARF